MCKRRGAAPPPELHNNIAALYHRIGDAAYAKLFYEKSLRASKCPVPDDNGHIEVRKKTPTVGSKESLEP